MFDRKRYNLNRYYINRSIVLAKLGGVCKSCGSNSNLEIDHINKLDKKVEISRILTYSRNKLDLELSKCQVLCRTCHSKKSIRESGKKLTQGNHGSLSCYIHRKCRCEKCKSSMREWSKEYRRKYGRKRKSSSLSS